MKAAPLHIIIFDGSLKTTTFINRLARGLAQKHKVTIVGFNTSRFKKQTGVHYKTLGNTRRPVFFFLKSILIALELFLKKGTINAIPKVLKWVLSRNFNALKQFNFDASISTLSPNIIHVQWPSHLPYVASHLKNEAIKVILSQRGYQNNVRPFVNSENFKYLQEMYPQIDGFHSVSKAISENGDILFDSPSKIDHVVYTGFRFTDLIFQKDYIKKTPLKILAIGRPHWIKGYQCALKALVILKEKGFPFSFEIIGAAGDEELLYLIDRYKLSNEVVLTGKIQQEDVYRVMATASVLLLSSLQEGIPNVVVEAMAVGLPVIATDCGGIQELIGENEGILVPPRNYKIMADAIIGFSEMPLEQINNQREKARLKVIQQHDTTKMIADMESLYLECINA